MGTSGCVDGRVLDTWLEFEGGTAGVDTERGLSLDFIEDVEREGPSLEATRADLSRKRLNSYFASSK